MCGLSAVLSREPATVDRLLAMHAQIPHRGPDGEGFLALAADGEAVFAPDAASFRARANARGAVAAFAFRWLQIQDRSAASHQPMSDAEGRRWLCMNGEIYNFVELRRELQALGHAFRTPSDTEVVLAAHREWGEACFARLRGMWAMLLVDLPRRRILISRDRLGIKPLFWSREGGALLLASEAKQIVASSARPIACDGQALAHYCSGSRPPPELTWFEGVRAFPAASFASVGLADTALEARPYWRLDAQREPAPASFELAVERLDGLVQDAVQEHLRAAVPVGALLSGGLDSSLVSAIASQHAPGRMPAFSFVLDRAIDRRLDESPYMRAVAESRPLDWHRTTLDAAQVAGSMAALTQVQEAPVTGLPVFAQHATHGLAAREGVRVVLDGQGADEIFAGYLRHQAPALMQMLLGGQLAAFGHEFAGLWRREPGYPATFLHQGVLSPLRKLLAPARRPRWFLGERPHHAGRPAGAALRPLDGAFLTDVALANLPAVLGITDRNSMAHSIEARVPLLDHRLVEFAFALPATWKFRNGERKHVLRELARRYLPSAVTERRDSLGFGVPQDRWMQGELRGVIADALAHETLHDNPLFDGRRVGELALRFRDCRTTGRELGTVWSLFALSHFFRAFPARVPD